MIYRALEPCAITHGRWAMVLRCLKCPELLSRRRHPYIVLSKPCPWPYHGQRKAAQPGAINQGSGERAWSFHGWSIAVGTPRLIDALYQCNRIRTSGSVSAGIPTELASVARCLTASASSSRRDKPGGDRWKGTHQNLRFTFRATLPVN
jgi:hypothetical protein